LKETEFNSFLAKIPKAEIHIHIEAVMSFRTIEKLYERRFGKKMSAGDEAELFSYDNLNGFIKAFLAVQDLFQSVSDFKYVFDDFGKYLAKNNIVYCEAFFAPSAFLKKGFDYGEMISLFSEKIAEIKDACRDAKLKVILETGALSTPDNIRRATLLALYSGADFIKTSTGKGYPGATPEAVYTICRVIKQYDQLIGRKVGVKVSGGIRSAEDAVKYYTIVKELLGDEWLTKEYFRIGASSLVADIEHRLGLGIR